GQLKSALAAWDRVAAAEKVRAANIRKNTMLESGAGFNNELFTIARTILRYTAETPKPNGERLREFRDSNLESLKLQLFSPEEIYDDYEIVKLADGLKFLSAELGQCY